MDSQKLLALSDTHGDVRSLKAVLQWAKGMLQDGAIRTAVFLGDGAGDLAPAVTGAEFFCEWKLVRGNNDFDFSIPEAGVLDFGDRRFFLCHGHRYALYNGYYTLAAAARKAEADAALFGHTHVPYCKTMNGIELINPGSIGRPRSRAGASFAVIECSPGKPLNTEFWGIGPQGKIFKIEV
jgi:putative phosphoesterase